MVDLWLSVLLSIVLGFVVFYYSMLAFFSNAPYPAILKLFFFAFGLFMINAGVQLVDRKTWPKKALIVCLPIAYILVVAFFVFVLWPGSDLLFWLLVLLGAGLVYNCVDFLVFEKSWPVAQKVAEGPVADDKSGGPTVKLKMSRRTKRVLLSFLLSLLLSVLAVPFFPRARIFLLQVLSPLLFGALFLILPGVAAALSHKCFRKINNSRIFIWLVNSVVFLGILGAEVAVLCYHLARKARLRTAYDIGTRYPVYEEETRYAPYYLNQGQRQGR